MVKHFHSLFYLLIIILFIGAVEIQSKPYSAFSIVGGIALPDDNLNNVYNSDFISTADSNSRNLALNKPDMLPGYSLNASLSFELSDKAIFFGGFGMAGFSTNKYDLEEIEDGVPAGHIEIKQSFYSLNAGINYFLFSNDLSPYLIANLSYNFLAASLRTVQTSANLRLANNPTDSRLGFTLGVGMEIPLSQFSFIVEGKYSNLNYIGKISGENSKSMYIIQIGFRF
ncbi:MAG: hypothetical protein WC313_10365 [Candidatus Kapaibacterium sp.]